MRLIPVCVSISLSGLLLMLLIVDFVTAKKRELQAVPLARTEPQ